MPRPSAADGTYKFVGAKVGRGKATVFSGFCGYHDKRTFQPIEDVEFTNTQLQQFLFAYRTFAFEFHKKQEVQKTLDLRLQQESELRKRDLFAHMREGYAHGLEILSYYRHAFDTAILDARYDAIRTVAFRYLGAAEFAVSSGFALEYDTRGVQLQRPSSPGSERLRYIFLNVFPQGDETWVLLSWLSEDTAFYEAYADQLQSLDKQRQRNYFNHLVPGYCENLAISPRLWDAFSDQGKAAFMDIFRPLRQNAASDAWLVGTPFNLFSGVL